MTVTEVWIFTTIVYGISVFLAYKGAYHKGFRAGMDEAKKIMDEVIERGVGL